MSRRLELVRLLEAYAPEPGERRARAEMLVLAASPADVFSRYHFDPGHFTASAFVIDENGGRLVLVNHERLGRWLQPGGHVDPEDDTLLDAARREVEEETGLHDLSPVGGVFDLDVHRIPAARGEPPHEHHDVRFLFVARGTPTAGDGTSGARWVDLDRVGELSTDASVRRATGKLLQRPPSA